MRAQNMKCPFILLHCMRAQTMKCPFILLPCMRAQTMKCPFILLPCMRAQSMKCPFIILPWQVDLDAGGMETVFKLVFISQVDFENFRFQWLPKFPLASFLTGRSDCHFLHLKYCLASKTYKNCYGPKFNVVWVRCINFFTQNSEYLWEFRMVFQIKHVFLLFICIKITSVPSNFTLIQNKKLNPPTLSYPSLSCPLINHK